MAFGLGPGVTGTHRNMRRVKDELRRLGATSPATARAFVGEDKWHAEALQLLVSSRIVIEPRPGLYYLDIEAESRQRKSQSTCLVLLLSFLAIGLLLVFGAPWLAIILFG